MAKKIMQFRYYNNGHNQNQPQGISKGTLVRGGIFTQYLPITQLGIQALPGTKFYLNNSTTPIIIGSTGIYEIDLEGLSEITDLRFDDKSVDAIHNNNNAYLIVDIIYNSNN